MHDGWISWREQGPLEKDAPGEPVLMIMGLGASSRLWFRLLPWIARRHRAIVFDNRGTGNSSPVRSRLSMRGLAHDARAVLDDAGVESAHVIGASMGGMIAQHLALEDRGSVRSLTLACTTPGGRSGLPPWRLMTTAALRPILGSKRTFPLVAPALYARDTLEGAARARVQEDLARRMRGQHLAAHAVRADGRDRRARHARPPGRAGRPLHLVVHGLEDNLVPHDRGRDLAALIPGARLELVPKCGHLLTTDAEEQVATAILAHLYSCAGKAAAEP